MTPADPPDRLEARLRATLHEGQDPARFGADDMLAAVHRRASRGRTRRRVASGTIVLAGVIGVAAATTQWPRQDTTVTVSDTPEGMTGSSVTPSAPVTSRTSSPSSTSTSVPPTQRSATPTVTQDAVQQGVPVKPDEFEVESVTAVRRDAFWVLGAGKCPEGTCKVIAHTTDAGATFSYRTGPDPGGPTSPATPSDLHSTVEGVDLRYAVTGDDAWGFGEEVWATHDAGRTWAPVTFPVPVTVSSVQAWDDTVWAFGTTASDGAPIVLSSPVSEDLWVTHDAGLAATDDLAAPVVADGVVAAFVTHVDGLQDFVRSRDGGVTWEAVPPPYGCETPLSSSGVEAALFVHCLSTGGEASLAVTADGGDSWARQPLPTPASELTTMTGIDVDRALITDGTALSIVTVGSEGSGTVQVPGPYDDTDPVWADVSGYTYAGFTDPATGYLITSGGELARTEDGGQQWTPVELP